MRRLSAAAIGLTLFAATVSAQAAGTLHIGIQDNTIRAPLHLGIWGNGGCGS
jgi:hypothetical protein